MRIGMYVCIYGGWRKEQKGRRDMVSENACVYMNVAVLATDDLRKNSYSFGKVREGSVVQCEKW